MSLQTTYLNIDKRRMRSVTPWTVPDTIINTKPMLFTSPYTAVLLIKRIWLLSCNICSQLRFLALLFCIKMWGYGVEIVIGVSVSGYTVYSEIII